jgi:hypothetical protein
MWNEYIRLTPLSFLIVPSLSSLIALLIVSLATWRVSSMLVQEDGPGNCFRRVRERMGFKHDTMGHVIAKPDGNVLGCLWCTSVWVACVLIVLPLALSGILAISGGAIIVNEKMT